MARVVSPAFKSFFVAPVQQSTSWHMRRYLSPMAVLSVALLFVSLPSAEPRGPEITTVALRVHHMDAMMAFYSKAFGVHFESTETNGITSQFGDLRGITLKFVPIREAADFEGWPSHQLGFEVVDVEAVIALAEAHGGRSMGPVLENEGRQHGAVRDPDGNTIELYGPR